MIIIEERKEEEVTMVRSADDSQTVSDGGEGGRTDNKEEEKRDCKSHSHPHLSSPLLQKNAPGLGSHSSGDPPASPGKNGQRRI